MVVHVVAVVFDACSFDESVFPVFSRIRFVGDGKALDRRARILLIERPLISINTTMDFLKSENSKGEQVHNIWFKWLMLSVFFFLKFMRSIRTLNNQ